MVKFYESLDSQGRVCIRLNRRNGRILARWRNDMPNQTRYQFVRERRAVLDGYGELCYTAIQCALMNTTRNALRHYCWNTSPRNIMNMCIKRDWYNAGSSVAYEHMLDFVRDNETIEDDSGKYLDVVEHIAKDIYEHTDIDDNSDFRQPMLHVLL